MMVLVLLLGFSIAIEDIKNWVSILGALLDITHPNPHINLQKYSSFP